MSEDNYNDFEKNDDEINDDEKNDKEKVISELIDFGFSIIICEKASFYCENNLKHCLEWIYYHQDDDDFNDELDTSNPDESKYYKNLNRKPASNINYNNELNNSYKNDKNNYDNNNLENNSKLNNSSNLNNNLENNSKLNNSSNLNNNNFGNNSNIINNDPSSKIQSNGSNEYTIFNNSKKIIDLKDENSIRNSMAEVYLKKLKNSNESPENNNIEEEESNKKKNESVDELISEVYKESNIQNDEDEKSSVKIIYTKDENISSYIKTLKKLYENKSLYGDALLTCFETLKIMLENIIKEPDNKKYLVINLDNNSFNERVGQYPTAIKILEEIGFTKKENNKLNLDVVEHELIQNTINQLDFEIEKLK